MCNIHQFSPTLQGTNPPKHVTPVMARKLLQQPRQIPAVLDPSSHVPVLLAYCLSDIVPTGQANDPAIKQLEGLPLLPLLDGRVATLQIRWL